MSAECNRRTALAILGGVTATAMVGCSDAAVSPTAQYRYGQDPSQFAEISLPGGTGPVPVVVIVHGGFWRTGYGLQLGQPLAADLVTRGFAAVNVEYRRVGGGGGWPQTGADVAAAVDALASEGQRLAGSRLDLSRVVTLGHSAGGQLAVWLAARRDAAVKVTGAVSQAGVLDLVCADETGVGGDAVRVLMGGPPSQQPAAYADASPIARVPLGVPSICVHGRDDGVVPFDQSERFVAAAVRAGDRCELIAFDGGHFELITVGTEAWTKSVEALTNLLS